MHKQAKITVLFPYLKTMKHNFSIIASLWAIDTYLGNGRLWT